MIKSILEKTRENIKPRFGYKEVFDRKSYVRMNKEHEEKLSEHEFVRRYMTMSYCAWIALAFCLASFVQISGASDIIGIIICVLAGTLFGMFYFSYIYKLWAARKTYSHLFKGESLGKLELTRFVDEAIVKPENMVPIKIKRKAGHG